MLSEQKRQQDEYVKYLEERLQESEKTATDIVLGTSSHSTTLLREDNNICMTESIACQTEETIDKVGNIEVKVEVPSYTLPLTTSVEKGSFEDENDVVAAGDGMEYCGNDALGADRIRLQNKMEQFGICF